MELFSDLFSLLANNSDGVVSIGGGSGMTIIALKLLDIVRGRNKADIAESTSEASQAKSETEQIIATNAPTIELAKTITSITEQQSANVAAQRDVATILQSLVEQTIKASTDIDDTKTSVSQIEMSMGEVVRMVNKVEESTGNKGEIVVLLRTILQGIDTLNGKVDAWIGEGEHIKQEVADTKGKVLDIEKRITSEQPVVTPDTQTYTPKEAPEKITGEMETVENRTQPIEPPIEEKKEEKSDGKL